MSDLTNEQHFALKMQIAESILLCYVILPQKKKKKKMTLNALSCLHCWELGQ